MKRSAVLFAAILLFTGAVQARQRVALHNDPWRPGAHPLLDAARRDDPRTFLSARKVGADIHLTTDKATFTLEWSAKKRGHGNGGNGNNGNGNGNGGNGNGNGNGGNGNGNGGKPGTQPVAPVIVVLPGENTWAFAAFDEWYPIALQRGWDLVVVQWWLGQPNAYLDELAVYKDIGETLGDLQPKAGTVLLYGYDRGAELSYAVATLDRRATTPWFAMEVADAGAVPLNLPVYQAMTNKQLGATPLAGTRWITFCGMRDPQPAVTGCQGMRMTADWITKLGGRIDVAFEDPAGLQNGFLRNPMYVERSLDIFASVIPKQ